MKRNMIQCPSDSVGLGPGSLNITSNHPVGQTKGMYHAKNRGNKEIPLAIRVLAQSCVTLPELCREGLRMIVLVYILDSIAKGVSLFPRFFAWCSPTSIFIHFCTCSTYFSWFAYKRGYALRACMRICVALRLYHGLV